MSERIEQSYNDIKGSGGHPYQSCWMSPCLRTSHNAAVETHKPSPPGNVEVNYARRDDSFTNGMEICRSAKRVGVMETINFRILDDNLNLSLRSSPNEEMHSSIFKNGKDDVHMRELSQAFGRDLERGKAVVHEIGIRLPSVILASNGAPGEGISTNPRKWMETHSHANKSSFVASKPAQETFIESSSHVVPYLFDFEHDIGKGKAAVSSLVCRSTNFANKLMHNDNLRMAEHEHYYNSCQPADLVYERKMDSHSQANNSMNAYFREINPSLLFDAPSTSDRHLPRFDQGWFQNMQKYSSMGLFPASEKSKSKKPHYDQYSVKKIPTCVHDVETMRICTTVGSVEGCPMFSQTTHNLLITKKTDVNVLKKNDILRSTRVITEMNGNTPSDLHAFFGHGNQGVKLQLLSNSTDSEGKGNDRDIKASNVTAKNESSAKTDTLDMVFFKENQHTGTDFTTSTKAFNIEPNVSPRVDVASSREAGSGSYKFIGQPDINLELPALPAPASFSDNFCVNSSRTQSLDMDMLHFNPKFNHTMDDSKKQDPSNRWVKRLKLSSLKYSARTTNSSNLDFSHEKINKSFSRILKNSITGAYPSKESDMSGDEDFSVGPTKKDVDSLLSDTWIQRWLSNKLRNTRKRPETGIVCQPQSSKMELKELEKKQFPSIAGMALMGKAMSGFQQCEVHKRGSFTVWKTKAF